VPIFFLFCKPLLTFSPTDAQYFFFLFSSFFSFNIRQQSCKLINWDYQIFKNMSFDDAFLYTQSVDQQPVASLNCKDVKNSFYYYQQEDKISIVPEVRIN